MMTCVCVCVCMCRPWLVLERKVITAHPPPVDVRDATFPSLLLLGDISPSR